MPHGSASVVIGRSIEDVFRVLSDAEKTPSWYPETIEERWLTDGPIGIGSRRLAVTRSFGVRNENEAVVTAYQSNRSLAVESVRSQVPFEISIQFEAVPEGTQVNRDIEMKPSGLMRPVVAVTFRPFLRQLQRALSNLKSMMESGKL